MVKRIVKELKLDEKTYLPKVVLRRISQAKGNFMDAKAYAEQDDWLDEDQQRKLGHLHIVYAHYEKRCRAANAMDYDDLLLRTYELFRDHPEVLRVQQDRFRYVLVDEFQDADKVQYAILQQLVAGHGNLCVIGDDAQSIYGFRGADVSNMRGFETVFPGTKVFKLERNYRSTQPIVAAANMLIARNAQRPKHLFTEKTGGEPVAVFPMSNDLEESLFVAKKIQASVAKGDFQYGDIAVVYRSNRQSRLLEEALLKCNIPYQVIGGLSFYERKEIKDLLAYLQLIVNEGHEEAMWRVINLPKRNIGPATIARIQRYAVEQGRTVWQTMKGARSWLGGRVGVQIDNFVGLIERSRTMLGEKNAYEIAQRVLEDSGLKKMMKADVSVEGSTRWENVQELLEALYHFAEKHDKEASLGTFLDDIALLEAPNKGEEDVQARVSLMTAHRTKGLEFGQVFIVGAEEKLFPHAFSMCSTREVEEERRLFFVAMTRAKRVLVITYAERRHVLGNPQYMLPSRFLQEIAGSGVVMSPISSHPKMGGSRPSSIQGSRDSKWGKGDRRDSQKRVPQQVGHKPKPNWIKPSSRPVQVDASRFQAGMRVSHSRFGEGTILSLERDRAHPKVVVHFLSGGQRSLLLGFAKLKVLEDGHVQP